MPPRILFLFVLLYHFSYSQNIKGVVLDAKTNKPIESVSIYFDNTTIGTTTNENGEFYLNYSDAIRSTLIFSFLGYETKEIFEYRSSQNLTIYLKESIDKLNEVVINSFDGLTREQKLKYFREEFLGLSKFGRSCRILNEDDLNLRYNRETKTLTANAIAPLKIQNLKLEYLITYDLKAFTLKFDDYNDENNELLVRSIGFQGNPFYQNLKDYNEKSALQNRRNAYEGSTLQFMRALYFGNLDKIKFKLFSRGRKRKSEDVFQFEFYENSSFKRVTPKYEHITVFFANREKSEIQILTPYFFLDQYGNYSDVDKIVFSGHFGSKRFGDQLPFDFGLNDQK